MKLLYENLKYTEVTIPDCSLSVIHPQFSQSTLDIAWFNPLSAWTNASNIYELTKDSITKH